MRNNEESETIKKFLISFQAWFESGIPIGWFYEKYVEDFRDEEVSDQGYVYYFDNQRLNIDFKHEYRLSLGKHYTKCLENEEASFEDIKEFIELLYKEWIDKEFRYEFTIDLNKRFNNFNIPYKIEYGVIEKISDNNLLDKILVQKTLNGLENYEKPLKLYQEAIQKYDAGIYKRSTLDDIRLSLEILLKEILNNDKSLENQGNLICSKLKDKETPPQIRNLLVKFLDCLNKYQNNFVKHDLNINDKDIEFIFEITSICIKYLIRILA